MAAILPLLTVLLVASNEMIQVIVKKDHTSQPQLQWQHITWPRTGAFKMYYVQTTINGLSYSGVKVGQRISHGHHMFLSVNYSDYSVGLTPHSAKGTAFQILSQNDSTNGRSSGRFRLALISGEDTGEDYTLHMQHLEDGAVRLFLSQPGSKQEEGSSEVYGVQICNTPLPQKKRRSIPKQN